MINGRSLIGIDLGTTNVRVALIRNDEIISLQTERVIKGDAASELLNQLQRLIERVLTPDVVSIGISVPSVVDVERGIVYNVHNIPNWIEVPVKSIFEEFYQIPVFVNNDANCFVVGEKYFGSGKEYSSIVGLFLGSGFGSGLIFNNRLFSGAHCGAGEIGMLPYKDSIFEHYCSGFFFERFYNIKGNIAYERAIRGDEEALQIFREFGINVGQAIKAVLYTYDPDLIVIGGSIRKAFSLFQEGMYESLQDFVYPILSSSLNIKVSELENIAVLGAAALSLDTFLK